MNKTMKKRREISPLYIFLGIILAAYTIFMLSIIVWGVLNSFKSYPNFHKDPVGFPSVWQFENYAKAFLYLEVKIDGVRNNIFDMFLNSILYAVGGALFSALSQCLTAYVCQMFNCKFSKFIIAIVVATLAIPLIGAEASTVVVLNKIRLYNTLIGVWFLRGYFIGVYFLVFLSAFKSIPTSYREAAMIDGAGNVVITLRIMLPLIKNIFFTIFLLNFINLWNDYNTALLYMPNYPTVAYGVWYYSGAQDNATASIPMKLAGCMLMLLPILLVFTLFSKRLLNGVAMGGVKE